jgi:hypothetical protein
VSPAEWSKTTSVSLLQSLQNASDIFVWERERILRLTCLWFMTDYGWSSRDKVLI